MRSSSRAPEYTGFDGAVFYLRLPDRPPLRLRADPARREPSIVWPSEARYVGEHDQTWIDERAFADTPGDWLRRRAEERGWRRLGVYGLDFVMNVRDYRALAAGDLRSSRSTSPSTSRAPSRAEELESVREAFA